MEFYNKIIYFQKYHDSLSNGVILIEKESGENVNEKVKNLILPSWKKDPSALSKLGKCFLLGQQTDPAQPSP